MDDRMASTCRRACIVDMSSTHQRFVNTTPKPRATKKSRGDEPEPPLLEPPPLPPSEVEVGSASEVCDGDAPRDCELVSDGEGDADAIAEVRLEVDDTACLIWCCRARPARLTRPAAISEPSTTMTTVDQDF